MFTYFAVSRMAVTRCATGKGALPCRVPTLSSWTLSAAPPAQVSTAVVVRRCCYCMVNCVSRFGLAVRRSAGKQRDLGSIPLRLSSRFSRLYSAFCPWWLESKVTFAQHIPINKYCSKVVVCGHYLDRDFVPRS